MRIVLAALVVLAIALAGIAVVGRDGADAGAAAAEPSRSLDLAVSRMGGEPTTLSRVAGDDGPIVVWFWAPWCEICNAEAGEMEELAGSVPVVAVGGRDSISAGREFVARHGLRSMTLVFDEPMVAWASFGVAVQPVVVVLDEERREVRRWFGAAPPEEILEAVEVAGRPA